jgi:peptide-methionine (R)-S-oxide reductase
MRRREFLIGAAAVALVAAGLGGRRGLAEAPETFEFTLTEAEWRERLTKPQFAVLREEATEPPWTSDLLDEKRAGIFHCAGCELPLYDAATKYDSGTGWPSFWEALPGTVGTKTDYSWGVRTEVHCARCGGHLGHIFNDGPAPTGKRHCINGVALTFVPATNAQG